MKKVWLVTQGNMSGHTVKGIFTSEELALKWSRQGKLNYKIEEVLLNDFSNQPKAFVEVKIRMKDGEVFFQGIGDSSYSYFKPTEIYVFRLFIPGSQDEFGMRMAFDDVDLSDDAIREMAKEKHAKIMSTYGKRCMELPAAYDRESCRMIRSSLDLF